MAIAPALVYFTTFVLLTFPLIRSFSTHFFTDRGDGLQNVWNMWWVDKAITKLGQLPVAARTTCTSPTASPYSGTRSTLSTV